MRTSTLAMIVIAGSAVTFPATAQQQQAAPSELTKEQMDKGLQTACPTRMQTKGSRRATLENPDTSALKKSRELPLIRRAHQVSRPRGLAPPSKTSGAHILKVVARSA